MYKASVVFLSTATQHNSVVGLVGEDLIKEYQTEIDKDKLLASVV